MNTVTVAERPPKVASPSSPPLTPPPPAQPVAPPVITSKAPNPRVLRAINPIMAALLRSPLHGVLSQQLFLLTVTGRRSGQQYTVPLGYLSDGEVLLVTSQHAEQKRWWRNLRGGAPVAMYLRGHRVTGHAEVLEEPLAVAAEIERLIDRLGAKEASRQLYMALDVTPLPTREQLAQALAGVVVVRITPDSAGEDAKPAARRDTLRKVLLGCGVLSSVLYVGLTSVPYEGYSPISQNVSELLANGAPTRPAMLVLLVGVYNVLVLALAVGVWMSPGRRRPLRLTAAMLVLFAILGTITGGIFNMDMRGAVSTPRGALHPAMTGVMSIPILLSMVVGAFLHGRRFGFLSLAAIVAGAVGGGLTVQDVPLMEAGLPTPWMGLKERINIHAYMLWIAVLALSLWPARRRSETR